MQRVHRRHRLNVNSGWRSSDDQALFFECAGIKRSTGKCPSRCQRSACASANRPGESNHEAVPYGTPQALAVDMEPQDDDWGAFAQVCREEGLHDPIPTERWHWQPVEASQRYYDGMP